MNKLIVTKWNNQILTALIENGRCHFLRLESEDRSLVGTICVGKVKNVVKNIGAAFIDLGNGQTGFYSLTENRHPVFADCTGFSDLAPASKRAVKPGDELIVQIERDAVKTKDPVLSCHLGLPGRYSVLTLGKTQLGFSAKIKDSAWKEQIKERILTCKEDFFGIIIRTNAVEAAEEEIISEIMRLKEEMHSILSKASCRTCYSVLKTPDPLYLTSLRDAFAKNLEAVVTDDRNCFDTMKHYLTAYQPEDLNKLTFYEDPMLPLLKLYSLETALDNATSRRVWLKSGGYLVIEPTEALTVIDVNTGKYSGKKNIEGTILKINLEAAEESARQIALRNLSGIIIIDFIDMETEEHKEQLLEYLNGALLKDPVKTVLVEMTKLGLVEITRKKVHRPLAEQIK